MIYNYWMAATAVAAIRVTPKNLLVPPALETVAEKWLATIAPATALM
ncbi:MAG: hypothetical protein ACK4GC_03965 [Paracoccaceae bacterium]